MKTLLKAAIVDDEQDLCFLLKNILRQENFDAVAVNSIHEASDKLKEVHPAIVFLDNHLPDGNGIQYLPVLRQELPCAKVVMMTAYYSQGEENLASKNGASCFIVKPLSRRLIERTIEKLGLGMQ